MLFMMELYKCLSGGSRPRASPYKPNESSLIYRPVMVGSMFLTFCRLVLTLIRIRISVWCQSRLYSFRLIPIQGKGGAEEQRRARGRDRAVRTKKKDM